MTQETQRQPGRFARALRNPVVWIVVATVMAFLLGGDEESSSLSWLIFVLFGGYMALWRAADRQHLRQRIGLQGRAAVAVYIGVGMAGGVGYELTLAMGGSGFGGLHNDTATSFLLLPGYLIPSVMLTLWMVRRYGLSSRDLFFVAGAMSWYEVITVGGATPIGAPLLAPAVVAFYVTSYAVYNGAYGLLLIEPEELWSPNPRSIAFNHKIALGVGIGAVSWACFIIWAAILPN